MVIFSREARARMKMNEMVRRQTDTIEQHAEAVVTLLESCLNHNLKPSAKGEDPPHAKISSDIISCIFLVSRERSTRFDFFCG